MKPRRKYDKTFKLEIVRRSINDECSIQELAEEFDIHPGLISKWRTTLLKTGEELSFPGNGNEALTEEQKEIRRLKRELSDARLETEILKKAIHIFSKKDINSLK